MIPRYAQRSVIVAAIVLSVTNTAGAQTGVGTAFTFQGRLTDGGSPASGAYDLQFALYDAATGGTQVAEALARDDVAVVSGLFTVSLDFGNVFLGSKRWLEIRVRPGTATGDYTILNPRQELTPAVNAIFSAAAPWSGVSGKPAGFDDNVDNDVLSGLSCTANQVPKWTGSAWACAAMVDLLTHVGTLGVTQGGTGATSVTAARANLGAAKSGANGDITALTGLSTPLSVAQGGTGATTGAAALAALGGQARVIGACAVGMSLQAINSDGSVSCQTGALRSGATLTTLDSVGLFGGNPSITIGTDGLGLISYHDSARRQLKVAHCANVTCTSLTQGSPAVLDSSFGPPSITVGADGLGLIAYLDVQNVDLKVAHCANVACTTATTATLDSAGVVGDYPSIAIGVDGLGLISYWDIGNNALKVAHCANVACSSATTVILDSVGGLYTSITIGADGLGLISYLGSENGRLKVAHCVNVACSSATTVTLESGAGGYTSIAIGADGLGLISYFDSTNSRLKVAHCANVSCSSATTVTLDTTVAAGTDTSITIGADGLGVISYLALNGDLKVARCGNVACSTATVSTLDRVGQAGLSTSITIGADGLPLISYQDAVNNTVKVAHCNNGSCSPFVVRRR